MNGQVALHDRLLATGSTDADRTRTERQTRAQKSEWKGRAP